ncbi:tetratricopeptide repeat protein [Shewanella livingstonensis]|uniref:Sel1 repeat family protein n=1 Tax=Shewanella livingstonensis TaxID=150120 RepID=A0A3G8LRZ7_9GAMM|nr:tetratricopeptide repeat protein [Shewanella livingstonensis]AZG71985.1 sel1 repeat family protein [Shewanella livingstonensis]
MHPEYDELSLWDDAIRLVSENKYDQAIYLYKSMAKNGIDEALVEIGRLYEMPSTATIEQDFSKAATFYKKAIDLSDDMYAYTALGRLYFFGVGVDQDYIKSKQLYLKAANMDGLVATLMLARIYRYGHGVQPNLTKAKELYQKSIRLGSYVALKESGGLDISCGEVVKGIAKVIKGNWNIFLRVRKDISNYGVIVSECVKNQ